MTEPLIKVQDVIYPRLRVPDLEKMERFLVDFGMEVSARTADTLYLRGTEIDHHIHVIERGAPAIAGLAFQARSMEDLSKLSSAKGASKVEPTNEPGGGYRVVMTDPAGFQVETVFGIEALERIPVESLGLNLGPRVERKSEFKRVTDRPARIKRLGHVGINVVDPDAVFDWYHAHFGILRADSISIGDINLAHFCRMDRDEGYTDHHSVLIGRAPDGIPGLNHMSWEVSDLDDMWIGQERLLDAEHDHTWGIGRHTLGSQIFDYWRDPWGQIHEHYTDGDLVNEAHEWTVHGPEGAASQWGPQMPDHFGRTHQAASKEGNSK